MKYKKKEELLKLKEILEEYYGFSINKGSRVREKIYAKKVFSRLGKNFGYTYQLMADIIGCDHATMIHHNKSFHVILGNDVKIYNRCLSVFSKLLENNEVELSPILVNTITDIDVVKAKYELLVAELRVNIFEQKESIVSLEKEVKSFENLKPILGYFQGWTERDREEFIQNRLKPYSLSLKSKVFN
jgi:hypothetical protein